MVLTNSKEFNRIATTVNNYMCMENCTAGKQKVFHLSPTFLALHSPLFTLLLHSPPSFTLLPPLLPSPRCADIFNALFPCSSCISARPPA